MIELVGRPLYQWDTGRKVRIVPLNDVQISEVHFANKGDTKALVVNIAVDESGVTADIPGKLLQTSKDLVVYAVSVSDAGEHTEESRQLAVKGRSKPDDYVYVEEDYYPLKAILDEKAESEEYLELVADRAVSKVLIREIVVVGNVEPIKSPALWFDTTNQGKFSDALLSLDEYETGAAVQAEVDGDVYAVQNATVNQSATPTTYDFTVL